MFEELGLRTEALKEKVTIKAPNGRGVDLMSTTVEIGLESLDGQVDTTVVAETPHNICERMKPTNWLKLRDQWKHLMKHSLSKTWKEG